MKFLLDGCISHRPVNHLIALGHDVLTIGQADSGQKDEVVLERAFLEGRILITEDNDFSELAILKGRRHCGIIRVSRLRPERYIQAILDLLNAESEDSIQSSIFVLEPSSVRRFGL